MHPFLLRLGRATLVLLIAGAALANDLRIGINADVPSFDPHHSAASIVGSRYYDFVFDTLSRIDADGRLVPWLASDWVADGLTWTFTIREGVTFHNGATLSADDVAFSLNRLLFGEHESPVRGSFTPFIASVTATGPSTVEIITPNPDPLLPLRLSSKSAAILDQDTTEALGYDAVQTQPIGTGPYALRSYEPGSRTVWTAFADHWGGAPAADNLIINIIPENATRLAALRSGEVDLITTIPPDLVGEVASSDRLGVVTVPLFNFMHIYFNTTTAPTDNVHLRRALSLLIDREAIRELLWAGLVPPMHDIFLPQEFGFDPQARFDRHDPEEAMRELALAGYQGEPVQLRVPANYYTNGRLVTDAIHEMWTEAGIVVDYAQLELAQLVEFVFAGRQIAALQSYGTSGDAGTSFINELATGGWISLYYPPSDAFKAKVFEAAQSLDQERRLQLYREIADIIAEDVPFAPLYQSIEIYGVRDGIDWTPHPTFFIDLRPGAFAFR